MFSDPEGFSFHLNLCWFTHNTDNIRDVSGSIIFTLAVLYNTQCTTFFEMLRFIHVHSVIWCFCKTEKKCEGECPFFFIFLRLTFVLFLVLLVVLLGWNLTCTLSGHNVDSRITQFHCAVWLTLGLPSSPSFDQQRTKWLTSLPPNLYAFRFASFFPPLLSGCTLSFEFCTCVSSLTACMICLLIGGCVLASSVYKFHVHENYCRMTPDLWPLTPMHMVCSFFNFAQMTDSYNYACGLRFNVLISHAWFVFSNT